MLNIVLFGPPGSGKGTQSQNIIKKYKLIHLATGDILREAVKNKTAFGLKVKEYLDKGELVPDQLVIDVITEKAFSHNNVNGFVFDGFPRTIFQAEKLDKILNQKLMPLKLVIAISVTEDELYRRILGRKITEARSDDNEDIIINRLKVYKNQTLPLFDYYSNQGKLMSVEGMASIDEVFSRICSLIDSFIDS